MRLRQLLALGCALTATSMAESRPATVRIEVQSRGPAFGGAAFGEVGGYERIAGVAHMRIDPADPASRGIVDLDRAPRAANGMVDYQLDLVILRPRDPARARRVMLYEVVNRGMKLVSLLTGGGLSAMEAAVPPPHDGVFRRGYTLVWSGWQGDVAGPGLLGARLPVATDGGRPITGTVSTETIFDDRDAKLIRLPWSATSLEQPGARLTVRQHADDPEQPITPTDWRFADERTVAVTRPADIDAGAIYRFSYQARDPKVMGLGFAGVRDLVDFLDHGAAADGNPLADLAAGACETDANDRCAGAADGVFDATIAFGISQSGRYLRDFVWQGFNRAGRGGRVFDGVLSIIPGGRRTFTNMRFAEPGRFSRQHEDHDIPGFDFPFAYATLRDAVTGRTDGILARCTADESCPKLFHIDTSGEFWQAGASLVGTGGGDHDVAFPDIVRAYMIAGASHAPGVAPAMCRSPANPLDYGPVLRAMVANMVDWLSGRHQPPPSVWPRVADGGLRPLSALSPPDLSAVDIVWPTVLNRPVAPPGTRGWPVLVPPVDADGNDVGGIRLPAVAVPDGTYLGWNLRKPGFAPRDLCLVYGGFVPFAPTVAEAGEDSRPSLAERYGDPGMLVEARRAAAEALIAARLIDEAAPARR